MFSKILDKCTPFTPYCMKMDLPQQRSMFAVDPANSHIKMGLFYEMLTACLFGGRLTDSLLRQGVAKYDGPMPDVWNKEKGLEMLWESKACRLGHQLNLLDGQIALYRKYQAIMPKARISYAVWRHRLPKIKSYKEDELCLFKELSERTAAGMVVPFSIVHHIHGLGADLRQSFREKYNISLHRYETDAYDHCTRTSSMIWNAFLIDPQTMITRLGLCPDDYRWERFLTPPEITLNGVTLQPVPFIFIADRNHAKNTKLVLDAVPF